MPLVGLTVIAAADEIARLREKTAETDWCKGAKLVELEPAEPIPPELIDKATVVVIQVDQNEPRSMRRVEQIHQRRPELPQVVALSDANLSVVRTMLRQGVADVVSLPLNPDEVLQAAITSVEKQSGPARAAVVRAPLVAVVRSLGGSGATTLVTHLARQFSQVPGPEHDVCIMDLDVQFGTVADVLGLHSRRNLSDVMEAGDRLDGQFLRSIAVERQSGLSVITAPPEISGGGGIFKTMRKT